MRFLSSLMRHSQDVLANGMTGSELGGRVERLLTAGRRFTRGASLATLVLMGAALVGLASISSRTPTWVAFAQEPPPAPPRTLLELFQQPVAPTTPTPPVAPTAPVAPAAQRPVAAAPPASPAVPSSVVLDRQALILELQLKLETQAENIRQQEAQLMLQKLDLERRRAELQLMVDRLRPQQESIQKTVEELQRRLEELKLQQQR